MACLQVGAWAHAAFLACVLLAASGQQAAGSGTCEYLLALVGNTTSAGRIDPTTPEDVCVKDVRDEELVLVFSDEFAGEGVTYAAGAGDPRWTAADLYYSATNDLEVYKPEAVTTVNGSLVITVTQETASAPVQNPDGSVGSVTKNFKSGMLQSWNKQCFRGGYFEARIQLPGDAFYSGLWPAFWMMGNLGRAGLQATNTGTWPYSYNTCGGSGQLSYSDLAPQAVSSCPDRPSDAERQRLGLLAGQGRGVPEIDILEVAVAGGNSATSYQPPKLTQSLQMAPVLPPGLNWATGPGVSYPGANTTLQTQLTQWFGPLTPAGSTVPRPGAAWDCYSAQSVINDSYYSDFHTYGVYWEPGEAGKLVYYIDGQPTYEITQEALAGACNEAGQCVGDRLIPTEPMYLLLNVALSDSFSPLRPDLPLPAKMLVDWVRVWQRPDSIDVGCSPEDAPTEQYIACSSSKYVLSPGDEQLIKGQCPPVV